MLESELCELYAIESTHGQRKSTRSRALVGNAKDRLGADRRRSIREAGLMLSDRACARAIANGRERREVDLTGEQEVNEGADGGRLEVADHDPVRHRRDPVAQAKRRIQSLVELGAASIVRAVIPSAALDIIGHHRVFARLSLILVVRVLARIVRVVPAHRIFGADTGLGIVRREAVADRGAKVR